MTLEQLRIFVVVAELEHVTRAARKLNLTQSAVSAAISALEQRHDIKLFDRIGRRVALTREGSAFLLEAKNLLIASQQTEKVLADIVGLKAGRVVIAASQTTGNYWLPPRIARFIGLYPGVTVDLTIGNTQEVSQLAIAGEIDLGLVEGAVADPALTLTKVDDDELVIVAAPALAKCYGRAGGTDIQDAPWVAREKGSGTREAFEEAIHALTHGAQVRRIVLELPSNEAVLSAIEAGAGLAVMSSLVARSSIRAGALVQLPYALPKRPFYLLGRRELYQSRATKAMLAMLQKETAPKA